MEEAFSVTEARSHHPAHKEAIVDACRARWDLESRLELLETSLVEQASIIRDLREKLNEADFQQRELLKGIATVVDDCDEILRVEEMRLAGADADGDVGRLALKWFRRLERTRGNLAERLREYGVSARSPVGAPSPDADTIHSTLETDATPAGEIVSVLRTGLLWKGSILRCSLVVIAEPKEKETLSEPSYHSDRHSDRPDESDRTIKLERR